MKHEDVWRALDTLAAEHGLSPSGLARKSGLDATTFNPSKRRMNDGRARWPSTESLAKVLDATGASLEAFTALVSGARALPHGGAIRGVATAPRLPLIGSADAGKEGYFDRNGRPVGNAWDEVTAPEIADENAYALEVNGDALVPVFRDGDVLIVSPITPIRRADRVVMRTCSGEIMISELTRRSARRVELRPFTRLQPDVVVDVAEIAWLHRVVWASQ